MEANEEYRIALKKFVRNAEECYLWYRDELERFYKIKLDKVFSQQAEESIKEWMSHLKEMENISEKWLKKLRTEIKDLNLELNTLARYNPTVSTGNKTEI